MDRKDTKSRETFRRQGGDKGTAYCSSKARGSKIMKETGKMGFGGKDIYVQVREG